MFNIFKNPKRKLLFKPKLGGWKPDPANKKYLKFERSSLALGVSKNQYQNGDDVDLRPYSSPRHNQLSTSTCVGQSVIKSLEIKRIMKHGHDKHVDLSVLDVYWGARERMYPPQTNIDGGTYISLACDVLRKFGVCRDELHPFKTENVFKAPPVMASREARLNRISSHFKIKTQGNDRIDDMVFNLKAGNPIVFGTQVGTDWFRYNGGKNPLGVEKDPKGGHAMICLGFINGIFIIENSWGFSWGEDGFAYVSPEVFTHPSTRDIWVMVDGSESWMEK